MIAPFDGAQGRQEFIKADSQKESAFAFCSGGEVYLSNARLL